MRRSMRNSIFFAVLIFVCGLANHANAQVRLPGGREIDPADYIEELWNLTTEKYYNTRLLRQKNWVSIGERYLAQSPAIDGVEELHAFANQMLAELKTSHLVVVHPQVYRDHLEVEFQDKKAPLLGLEIVLINGKYFVGSVLETGPAAKAGLRIGDEIVAIDGLPTRDAEGLHPAGHDPGLPGAPGFVLTLKKDQRVQFRYRRVAGGETKELTVKARLFNMIEAVKESVKIIEKNGQKIGYIHLWHFIHMKVYAALKNALAGPFKSCDAIILDLRGRGGSTAVVNGILGLSRAARRSNPDRPLVALTDSHTRSAKEIFSYLWQQRQLGPVVGETTQGACIGTTFHKLLDGSYALMPQVGVSRLTDGVEIEGRGVAPTIEQKQLPVPYRNGRDVILERGVKVALSALKGKKSKPARRRGRVYAIPR